VLNNHSSGVIYWHGHRPGLERPTRLRHDDDVRYRHHITCIIYSSATYNRTAIKLWAWIWTEIHISLTPWRLHDDSQTDITNIHNSGTKLQG